MSPQGLEQICLLLFYIFISIQLSLQTVSLTLPVPVFSVCLVKRPRVLERRHTIQSYYHCYCVG